jgi:hypothetical protein
MALTRAPNDDHTKRILKALLEAGGQATIADDAPGVETTLDDATGLGPGPISYRVSILSGEENDSPLVEEVETPLVETRRVDPDEWRPARPRLVTLTEAGEGRAEVVADDVDVEVPDDYVRPRVEVGLEEPDEAVEEGGA